MAFGRSDTTRLVGSERRVLWRTPSGGLIAAAICAIALVADVARGATISGTIRDLAGDPVPDIRVTAYDPLQRPRGQVITDTAGRFRVERLHPGSYRILLRDFPWPPRNFPDQWFGGSDDFTHAQSIALTVHAEDVDIVLRNGGRISGAMIDYGIPCTCSDPPCPCPTPVPIYSCVEVSHSDGRLATSLCPADCGAWYPYGGASRYSVVVPPGDYRVAFRKCFAEDMHARWYPGTRDPREATIFHVSENSNIEGINEVNGPWTTTGITGTVRGTSGDGLATIAISAYDAADGHFVGRVITDSEGRYSFGGLFAGSYDLQFRDFARHPWHAGEWYDDAPGLGTATAIVVKEGDVTSGIDASLDRVPPCHGHRPDVVGTRGDDFLDYSDASIATRRIVIVGYDGDDEIVGSPGNDVICGGRGNDVIRGGSGDDKLDGGPGN